LEPITLPQVGDTIDTTLALKLCKHFSFDALAIRIQNNPENYNDWVFDGASMLPDKLFSKIFHIPNLVEVSLKHDLKYAYGESGNNSEKHQADLDFQHDLIADGASNEAHQLANLTQAHQIAKGL
jgi:hypothetical protein